MPCGNDKSATRQQRQRRVTALILATAWILFWGPKDLKAGSITASNSTGIFGSTEIQGNLSILERWQKILGKGESQFTFFATCSPRDKGCPAASVQWRKLARSLREYPALRQLQQVNTFFNRWPYMLDQDLYNVPDYWAAPLEFITRSGDCEDYAITKYFALKRIGIKPSTMRIVILEDSIRNVTHAVLTVTINSTTYVLDNMSDTLFPDSLYTHYRAQFSFNEHTLRLHLYPHPTLAQ